MNSSQLFLPLGSRLKNGPQIQRVFSKIFRRNTDFLEFEDTSVAKTLGIRWNAQFDVFYFLANPLNKTSCTKRAILSQIAKLFDPAACLAPSIIITKMIMQQF